MWLVTPRKDAKEQVIGSLIYHHQYRDHVTRNPTAQACEHDKCEAAKLLARAQHGLWYLDDRFQINDETKAMPAITIAPPPILVIPLANECESFAIPKPMHRPVI